LAGKEVLVVGSDSVPGREIAEVLGVVWGSCIKAKHVGKDFVMGIKKLTGGELGYYTEMLEEARKEAFNRMVEHARELGADAIVSFRFATSMVTTGAAEILAYGTAVKLK